MKNKAYATSEPFHKKPFNNISKKKKKMFTNKKN